MSRILHVTMPALPDPRQRILWDALAVRLDVQWEMHSHFTSSFRIVNGVRSLTMPSEILAPPFQMRELERGRHQWRVLHPRQLGMHTEGGCTFISGDVISPLAAWAALVFEDSILTRAVDGTLAGASYASFGITAQMLSTDFVGELAALIAQALGLSMSRPWQSIAPDAPYAVVMTFDCDGFLPGQPAALRHFLDRYPVHAPTLFLMAPAEEDRSLFDPRYDPADPELSTLLEICEPGLHSSYRGYNDGQRIASQKVRLEKAIGRSVHGHRSHYLRFEFPYTWGYVAKAGFDYDMTMGFFDLPGYRQGSSHPIPLADPSGRGRLLWSWGVGLMDQHMFMPGSPLAWNAGKSAHALDMYLSRLRASGGVLVLDWHVHSLDKAQFPEHFTILDRILRRAVKDKAWIGGAGALLESYRARASAKQLAAQVMIETRPTTVVTSDADALHAGHYIHGAGEVNLTSVQYIDAGAASFLSALPADAVRIADIGCGSGWISNRAPPMRQVIGIDIDADITQRITRRSEVGILPNLPLKDAQVDLVLCTDVIEHLSPAEVKSAGEEFDRISRRYVYLQTPSRERLVDGERKCSFCGERWHVNHHLASYDAAELAAVMPAGWYLHTVTYTGEAWLVDSSLRDAKGELLGPHPMLSQRFTCAACGKINEGGVPTVGTRLADAVERQRRTLPHYSEVAVLMAREGVTRPWQDSQPGLVSRRGTRRLLPQHYRTDSNTIDFQAPVEEMADAAPTYQVPCVVLQHALLQRGAEGMQLVTSALAESSTLFMLFPDQHEAGEYFTLTGRADGQVALSLEAFNWRNDPCGVKHKVVKGDFRIKLKLDAPAYCVALYVPTAARIVLSLAKMSGPSRPLYCYDFGPGSEYGHVEVHRLGVLYRWLVPSSGRIWADKPFMREVATVSCRSVQPDKRRLALTALGMEDGLVPAALPTVWSEGASATRQVPRAVIGALLRFPVEGGSRNRLRLHIVRWLLSNEQRFASALERLLPRRTYLTVRAIYVRFLRYLT